MGEDMDDDMGDGPEYLSQIGLISAVLFYLDKCGEPMPNTRQMKAVIDGANGIMAELDNPTVPATDGMGLGPWLRSDDTGMSSGHMARVLQPLAGPERYSTDEFRECHHPHDPEDFGRCYRLLRAVPELRPHLPAMAGASKEWAALVAAWDELERLYEEERPSGRAPKLYARMRELLPAG